MMIASNADDCYPLALVGLTSQWMMQFGLAGHWSA